MWFGHLRASTHGAPCMRLRIERFASGVKCETSHLGRRPGTMPATLRPATGSGIARHFQTQFSAG